MLIVDENVTSVVMRTNPLAKQNIPLNVTSAGETRNEMFCTHVFRLATSSIHFQIPSQDKLTYLLMYLTVALQCSSKYVSTRYRESFGIAVSQNTRLTVVIVAGVLCSDHLPVV